MEALTRHKRKRVFPCGNDYPDISALAGEMIHPAITDEKKGPRKASQSAPRFHKIGGLRPIAIPLAFYCKRYAENAPGV